VWHTGDSRIPLRDPKKRCWTNNNWGNLKLGVVTRWGKTCKRDSRMDRHRGNRSVYEKTDKNREVSATNMQPLTNVDSVHKSDKNSTRQTFVHKKNCAFSCHCHHSMPTYLPSDNVRDIQNTAWYIICIQDNIYCMSTVGK
jgi:hypothetical protein